MTARRSSASWPTAVSSAGQRGLVVAAALVVGIEGGAALEQDVAAQAGLLVDHRGEHLLGRARLLEGRLRRAALGVGREARHAGEADDGHDDEQDEGADAVHQRWGRKESRVASSRATSIGLGR